MDEIQKGISDIAIILNIGDELHCNRWEDRRSQTFFYDFPKTSLATFPECICWGYF
jgi:hypothetical protein